MKATYQEIMDKLGVGRPLNVYETQPWLARDDKKGWTCEAEVRCNSDKTEVEAEIQLIYDTPAEGQRPVEQICLIRVIQQKRLDKEYTVVDCIINGHDYKGDVYDWETKSCAFFRISVKDIKQDKIPDFTAIEKKEMKESGQFGGKQGDGSNKAPKINASQLMYDRKGIGAGF
tara:strand:- start:36 stop:554 length:519 start_codon:yes stop_codon:yes gene_type:complete